MKILISALALVSAVSCGGPVSVVGTSVLFEDRTVGSFESVTKGDFSFKDRYRVLDDGIIEFERTFTALENIDSARVELQFVRVSASSYAMIPAVCYNGNEWGRGNEPKGFETGGITHTYSYRRTSIPGATYSEGDGFSCSILPGTDNTVHSLIRPVEEGPRAYDGRDHFTDGSCIYRDGTVGAFLIVPMAEAAEQSAYYLSTWMWHYREIYPEECDFTQYGLNTFGLTAVSTQHQHLDPYALKYVPDLLRLAELTGNQTWKERAAGDFALPVLLAAGIKAFGMQVNTRRLSG